MIDNYLTHEFRERSIDDLLDFLFSLDDTYHWEGGLLPEYSNSNATYFLFWEASQQNVIFAKCFKELKMNTSMVLGDIKIAHQEVSYKVISVSSSKQYDINNEEEIKKELSIL
jgi:hypothetical protein